ncbi:hypothetical protein D3C77_595240 [compost metagenome]
MPLFKYRIQRQLNLIQQDLCFALAALARQRMDDCKRFVRAHNQATIANDMAQCFIGFVERQQSQRHPLG